MANPTASKPKEVVLSLPVPHRIGGDVDAMLMSTIADKFMTVSLLHPGEKDINKGQMVLSHTPDKKDPNVQVSVWNPDLGNLVRYIQALVNAWSSGTGQSGEGSCMYLAQHTAEVAKVVPELFKRDLFLVPNGRSGVAKYRESVQKLVDQVLARSQTIKTCKDAFGIASSKERTKSAESTPSIHLV